MRGLVISITCVLVSVAAGQQVTPAVPESARAESARAAGAVANPLPPALPAPVNTLPPAPSPAQLHYLQGLKTVGRGIAQLKDGVNHVTSAGRDSVRLKQAGHRLAGMCGAAQGFLARGRSRMSAAAYADSTALKARKLLAQIDTLNKFAPTCLTGAAKEPTTTATQLSNDLKGYDAALKDFRAAIALPVAPAK